MSKETNAYQGFAAFQGQVNIELFNDIMEFVAGASAENNPASLRTLEYSHLWYSRTTNENIQQKYGFRYLGELLERYEERHGSDIADVRAIALALAYAKDMLTDDMFVGKQKGDFISKVVKILDSDIYLKGALYRLGLGEYNTSTLLNDLTNADYTKTEQLIFVISLFDDFGKAFTTFKPHLIRLLGAERSIPIDGNADIFCWLIRMLLRCSQIKTMRTKDMTLFRALMELATSFVKEGNRYHGVLLDNGYTALDIVYLNSSVVRYRPTSEVIDTKSIVAEKIAIEMCTEFINSNETHSPHAYEHLEWLFGLYETFIIKIRGCSSIYDAIKHNIKLTNPQTFIWLFKLSRKGSSDYYGYKDGHLPDDLFCFDINDSKWDVLAGNLNASYYRRLFDRQLMADQHEMSREQVEERLARFDTLSGYSYLEQFRSGKPWLHDDSIFTIMVQKGIIELVSAFESCENLDTVDENTSNENRPAMLSFIKCYIKGIGSREAFDFFRYFFSKYSFDDMHRLFVKKERYGGTADFFAGTLYNEPSNYRGNDYKPGFKIERPFLSDDEHRELFGWLDDYMLEYKPSVYTEFAMVMLTDDFIAKLYPKELLRTIYDMVKNTSIWDAKSDSDTRAIKDRYMSEEELKAERDAENALKAERKRQDRENMIRRLEEAIVANYDGSLYSIYKFMNKHEYSWKNENDVLSLIISFLERTLADKNYVLGKSDFIYFLTIGSRLYEKDKISFVNFKNHISKVEESKEENEDVEND